MTAVKQKYKGNVLVPVEGFANHNAFELLADGTIFPRRLAAKAQGTRSSLCGWTLSRTCITVAMMRSFHGIVGSSESCQRSSSLLKLKKWSCRKGISSYFCQGP